MNSPVPLPLYNQLVFWALVGQGCSKGSGPSSKWIFFVSLQFFARQLCYLLILQWTNGALANHLRCLQVFLDWHNAIHQPPANHWTAYFWTSQRCSWPNSLPPPSLTLSATTTAGNTPEESILLEKPASRYALGSNSIYSEFPLL
jgi:hypothetical protein